MYRGRVSLVVIPVVLSHLLLAPPLASAHPAAYVAKFLGEYAAGKGLDALFDSAGPSAEDRVRELDLRLASYESTLRQVDAKVADQVASLRKELSTKTTREDVRSIVKKTLGELDGRIRELEAGAERLENRQDKIDERVKQIEELFGHIPSVPPAPLLMSSVEAGEPKAHPLTLEWLKLLSRSEQSREELAELRRTHADTSKAVLEALKKDKSLLIETAELHDKVGQDLARRLADRQELLREYKPGAAKVRAFDEEMASVTWLMAVTRPISRGPHAGRLGVPPALFGPQASEIILAFKLAKAEPGEVADLYRRHLLAAAATQSFFGVSLDRGKLTKEMAGIGEQAVEEALKGFELGRQARKAEREIRAALKDLSAESPEVKALRAEQGSCMAEVRKLHQRFGDLLKRGSELYVAAMEHARPTNARMTAFREGVLQPLANWTLMTRSQEEGNDPETLNRLSGQRWFKRTNGAHLLSANRVAWSPDGKRLASTSESQRVNVWDAETGERVLSLTGHERGKFGGGVLGVAWSPDGKRLATASRDMTAKVWDAETGKEVLSLTGHLSTVSGVAWSPDGKHLATSSWDNSARVWDAGTGIEISCIVHKENLFDVAWSALLLETYPLATASRDQTVRTWPAGKGLALPGELNGHTKTVGRVAWSPDGKRIATASWDKTAKVWDAKRGKEVLSFTGHTAEVYSVAWSPDGKRIATGSADETVKVWDAESGKEVLSFTGHTKAVLDVAWSPDGKHLATASGDRTAMVWSLAEEITRASRAK